MIRLIITTIFSLLIIISLHNSVQALTSPVFHFGFKKSVNEKLPSIDEEGSKSILEKYGAIFMGDTRKKTLYLTFDNGYENGLTPQILSTLKAKKVPAIFFVTGHYVDAQPELINRMVKEGHLIGNHSWSHPNMASISESKIRTELNKVKEAVKKITGQKEMRYLRPPSGIFNDKLLAVSKNMGYINVFWSIAYKDWDVNAQRGIHHAYNKVTKQLHPGGIILLHSISKDNTAALGNIIDSARQRGYQFASLDQLPQKS